MFSHFARFAALELPTGKPAGVRCVQLDEDLRCRIFGRPERPPVCGSLPPSEDMCGDSREQAMRWLGWMEEQTAPDRQRLESAPP